MCVALPRNNESENISKSKYLLFESLYTEPPNLNPNYVNSLNFSDSKMSPSS